jgi:protein SCO1/2
MTDYAPPQRPTLSRRYVLVCLALAVVCAGAVTLLSRAARTAARDDSVSLDGTADPLAADPNLSSLTIPDFTLVDQEGSPATRDIFSGRLTVLAFGFTNCPFACPLIMARMVEAQNATPDIPLRFVFISVDPDRDPPQALRDYRDVHGGDPARWTLLTGDAETVRRMITEGLLLALEVDPARSIALPDGSIMPNINHPTHLILVGPDARILGLYGSSMPGEAQRLAARARAAALRLIEDSR